MSINLESVSYTYLKKTPLARSGLAAVTLAVGPGEWLAVMGATGSGKSTLLMHLNGLLKPDSGRVLLAGVDIHRSAATLKEARRQVGLVFQYPERQLFGSTVWEEIAYGPQNFSYPEQMVEQRVTLAMEAVGLACNRYRNRSPFRLSGGEKRRVALAGVLATQPKVLALDEPTAGLDPTGRKMFIETVKRLHRDQGLTIIWVTHEIAEIAGLADNLAVLDQGQVCRHGSIRQVLADPVIGELGLDIPLPVQIARMLREKGRKVTGDPVTLEEIQNEIIHNFR